MNREPSRRLAEALYARLITRVIRALGPCIGLPASGGTLKNLSDATRGLVQAARDSVQQVAYQDYVSVVGDNPLPKAGLTRFTEGLWDGVVAKAAQDDDTVTPEVARKIGMSADRWARDAEWGQRYQSAKADPRIGRVARVDFEPPTCPWCTLLNARGAVYLSSETGAATLHEGDTCTLVFVLQGETAWPGKEHTDAALEKYKAARKAAASGKTEDILRAMRSSDQPGTVRANADAARAASVAEEHTAVSARIATLERMNPVSVSAKAYRAEQLARNIDRLTALERHRDS